jgi:hypothetical protein
MIPVVYIDSTEANITHVAGHCPGCNCSTTASTEVYDNTAPVASTELFFDDLEELDLFEAEPSRGEHRAELSMNRGRAIQAPAKPMDVLLPDYIIQPIRRALPKITCHG